MAGKPFAFVAVVHKNDIARAKASVEKHEMTWRCFQDDQEDSIFKQWNVRSWPNIWVLDRQGLIRYRDVRGRELADSVNLLLQE